MKPLPFIGALLSIATAAALAQAPAAPAAPAVPATIAPPAAPAAAEAPAPEEPAEALPRSPAPAPPLVRTGAPRPAFAMENQLIKTGGFERPLVKGRMPKELKEGNFIRFTQGEWLEFWSNDSAIRGKLHAGLTNETARTGRQSLYLHFDHMTERLAEVNLASDLLAVKPNEQYRIAIFGRIDRKDPLTLDQRAPVLRLQVDFFQADRETQTGETVFKVQPIPGTPNRPLFFTSDRWSEFYVDLKAPEDAGFIKIMWTWATTPDAGKTNGVIYFDDAIIEGVKPEMIDTEPTEDDPAKPTVPPAPGAPATSAPAAPPAPAPPKEN